VPELGASDQAARARQHARGHRAAGAKGFYTGRIAQDLVNGVRAGGGIWTLAGSRGLSGGRAQAADRRVPRRAHRVRLAALLGRSGVARCARHSVGYDLKSVDSATRKHLVIEAMQRAYRDRAVYLGDPDFVTMPLAQLTSKDYAAGQRTSIRTDKAMPSDFLPGIETRRSARTPRTFRCSTRRAIASQPPLPSTCSSARATWSRRPAYCSTTKWMIFPSSPERRTPSASWAMPRTPLPPTSVRSPA
jgi:hypothetical protein